MEGRFVREALLQEGADPRVRCHTCERRCLIAEGARGWCRTRENQRGRLLTLIYGAVSSLSANPIEKKPFYHFHPGSVALTAGSWSCNFGCPWCQNWELTKASPPATGRYLSPERFVELAEGEGCQGTSISFNEPALSLEWSLEVFRLARRRGLYNTYVTNGYLTAEALEMLVDAGLDAMNVDVKGDAAAVRRYCGGIDVEKVWATCSRARAAGVHLEVTTLVVPGVNDADEALRGIAARLASDLGPDVPWHVSGYYPAYEFDAPPTPLSTLERAWRIGKDQGLEFVYLGNVAGHRHGDTFCPACGGKLIRRLGLSVLENTVRDGRCPQCGRAIAGVWGGASSRHSQGEARP